MSPTKRPLKLPVEDGGTKKNNNKSPRSRHLLKKFGITEEQYDELFRRQDGCCAICLRPAGDFKYRLAVDHDHFTGHVRGLLCYTCNRRVVGRHRKDNATILERAYRYLISEYPGWIVPPKKKRKKRRRK